MSEPRRTVTTRRLVALGVLVSLVVAGVLSYVASASPDGLQSVAGALGFQDSARDSAASDSPLAGYGVDGVSDGFVSGGLAGVLGVLATALLMAGLVWLLVRLGRRRG